MIIRPATAGDGPFLRQALAWAADWRPNAVARTPAAIMAVPELAHYVDGWSRPGDVGVVAMHAGGDGTGTSEVGPIGAAWWRYFSTADPGYGFVDEATPELSIGLAPHARGHGVGTELLRALIDEARRCALPVLSLSVETDNPATRLYARLGFRTIVEAHGARTMLLRLGE